MKRQWIAGILALMMGATLLTGCAEQQADIEHESVELELAMVDKPTNLDPISATDVTTQTVLANVNDNLMTQTADKDGALETVGALAKSVETTDNEDGTTTYTFTLRRAYWSDGQSVSAQDFEYAWKRLANPENGSPYGSMLSMVVGYDKAVAEGDMDLLAVDAVDETTFAVTISYGNDWFLSQVCTAIATQPVREDATFATSGKGLLTCGAYTMDSQSGDTMVLSAFADYYENTDGADVLNITFYDTVDLAWEQYEQELADFISVVPEAIYTQLLDQEVTQMTASRLETVYVAINNQEDVLSDVLVRQALYNSVDFDALLQSQYSQVAQGLVSVGVQEDADALFRDRDLTAPEEMASYASRQMSAQLTLAQSTYPVDEADYALGLLCLSEEETTAQLLAQQWQVSLGITVDVVTVTQEEMTQAMTEGTYQLALTAIDPQINDAEPYLNCWTSESTDNVLGYANTAYDMLLSVVAVAGESSGRLGCLHDAQALMMEEFAAIPLYCENTAWLLGEGLQGLARDSRGWFMFASVK